MSTAASAGSRKEAGRLTGSRFTFTLFMLAAISANPAFAAELNCLPQRQDSAVAQLMLGTLQAASACDAELLQDAQPATFAQTCELSGPGEAPDWAVSPLCTPPLLGSDLAACTAARAP